MSYAVFQLARTHRGHAVAMLRAMNLRPGQELQLMQLFDHEGLTQAELLERVASTTPPSPSPCGGCRTQGC
ncbi:hypothetical protein SUDANB146_00106 [Streptomyces sp. enrichment culture]